MIPFTSIQETPGLFHSRRPVRRDDIFRYADPSRPAPPGSPRHIPGGLDRSRLKRGPRRLSSIHAYFQPSEENSVHEAKDNE